MTVVMDTSLNALKALFSEPITHFGNRPISLGEIALAIIACLAVLIIWRIIASIRHNKSRASADAAREAVHTERARESELRMAELIASQNALTGRMQTMGEMFSSRQGDMIRSVNERLEGMSG
ncbi:MAG: hypothetical protein JKX93_18740, partial [Rhizobiaceae bacterium]|nr:hypothetical protein [Rhizobiaceae bacterium]